MKIQELLYRPTLKVLTSSCGGWHDLLKYKDDNLEVWVMFADRVYSPDRCDAMPNDIFIRYTGRDFEPTSPEHLIETNGKIIHKEEI